MENNVIWQTLRKVNYYDIKWRSLLFRLCLALIVENLIIQILLLFQIIVGGGYEFFNLPKNSPTVGSYFFADDYIKLIQDPKKYLSKEIEIINARESVHADVLTELNQLDVPVGKLAEDVEVVLLHYHDPKIAKEKWIRRVDCINWNNLIIKFSYMSKCTDNHIREFQRIQGVKKFCFIPQKVENMEDLYYYPSCIDSLTDLGDDVFYWNRYIDVIDLINRPQTGIDKLNLRNV